MRFQKILFSILLYSLLLCALSCSKNKESLKIIDVILRGSTSYFYTDLKVYNKKNPKLPIGIFDSGTGGLTVLDAIVNFDEYINTDHSYSVNGDDIRDFNKESFIYLADQANMPYGNYGEHNKSLLLREHVLKDMQFLMSNKYYQSPEDKFFQINKSPIKAMVIACNTATAFAKQDIENFMNTAGLDLKVIGVIGAGVRAALENISMTEDVIIAIMATAGTIDSQGYIKEIRKQLKWKKDSAKISIYQQAGIGLAGAIDGAIEFIDESASEPRDNYKGPSDKNNKLTIDTNLLGRYNFDWSDNRMLYYGNKKHPENIQINSVDNYISYHLTTLLEQIMLADDNSKLSKIILGCTHYPFYTDLFEQKLEGLRNCQENGKFIYKNFISENVQLIDPAVFTAKELYKYLLDEQLFNNGNISNSEFYISVPNFLNKNIIVDKNSNFEYDYKYGREVNNIQEYVKRVPFNSMNIAKSVSGRLEKKIPYTYSLIKNFDWNNSKTKYLSDKEKLY